MVTKNILIVFILPAVASLAFGGAVMYGLAYEQDGAAIRPASKPAGASPAESQIGIDGLSSEYSVSDRVDVQVQVDNPGFECGDLYITIYKPDRTPVMQKPFLKACLEDDGLIPAKFKLSKLVSAGTYVLEANIIVDGVSTLTTSETFTVK
ncbi:MAG: hypothetical protein EB829_05705 [Nitrosopumilus sp. H8]|nr:MAG: hypothetical protein EB830_06570 [Nitrosopumilus sp. H13]RNJ77992.1 MAG: hypothetical protein EB829_05705 [Nitrosopumilus sp. H8]